MKKQLLLFFLLASNVILSQTILMQESFETDGEGSRYTSNTFYIAANDYFARIQDSQIPGTYAVTNIPGAEDGSFYWSGEDTDQASGGEGVITFNSISVTGYNLDVDILVAVGRPNDGRLELTDYLILEYNMDGGGWNIFGAMYGNEGGIGNLQVDGDLDGSPDASGAEANSSNFQGFNFTIPVTGNNVQIRLRVLANTGTEELLFDNIRINGTSAASNSAPTDISLSSSSIGQSATGVNASVGTLTTTDADAGDSHTYSLVPGTGDTNNGSFNISGSTLRTSSALSAGSYSVRINTNDGTDDYAEQFSITVTDDVAPVITSVSVPIADTYVFNQNLDFTLNFDENVSVNTTGGTPQLALTIGSTTRQAVYQSGSGTQNLVFRYTVQDGDADGDGIVIGTLSANSGTLRDAANNDANLTLNNVGNTTNVDVLATDVTYSSGSYSPTDPSGLNLTGYTLDVQDGTAVITAVTTFDDVTVQPDAVLDLNANLTVNNELLFQSDATGSGQLADATGATVTGDVRVERYFSNNRAFRLVASPVTTTNFISNNWQQNTHITGAQGTVGNTSTDGFDETATGNPSMFTFDNGNSNGGTQDDDYTAIPNTNATNLVVGTPYVILVRGNRNVDLTTNDDSSEATLSATGSLHVGEYPGSSSSVPLSNVPDFWSLVANPYQANVDYDLLAKAGDLRSDISVYDPANKGYVALSSNRIIKPGQSFWVQNQATVNTTPSLYFEEADKAVGSSNATVVFGTNQSLAADLELYRQGENTRKDILQLRFNSNFDSALDNNDFGKLLNTDENLATNFSMLLSIDRRGIPQDNDIVPLFTNQYRDTNYEFRINLDNWDPNVEIFVQDDYLNTTTPITPNQAYAFSVDANIPESIAEDRFSLVFDNTTLGVAENTFGANFCLYPNPAPNGRFYIATPGLSGAALVTLTNVLGQQVYAEQLDVQNQEVQVYVDIISSGVYMMNLSQGEQSFSTKVIIE